MASGDVVGMILQSIPPGSSRADPGVRQSASSQAENWTILSFDDTTEEYWYFLCALEGYDGGGLTIELPWMSEDQTTGNVGWVGSIRRIQEDTTDLDTSFNYDTNEQTVTEATASAAGEIEYSPITFSNGTQMNSTADGERFMLRINRDPTVASDMTNDAQLLWPAIVIRET